MDKFAAIVSVLAFILAGLSFFAGASAPEAMLGGFTNYDQLAVGSSSPVSSYEVAVGSAGTTTVALSASGSLGTCIEMKSITGSTTKAYVTGTSSPSWVVAAGTCE